MHWVAIGECLQITTEHLRYIYIYVLDKALPQVLSGKYSMKRVGERQI